MNQKCKLKIALGNDGELLQDRADAITLPDTSYDVPQVTVTGLSIPSISQPIVTDQVDKLPMPVTCKYCGAENPAGGPLQCIKCGGWLVELEHVSTKHGTYPVQLKPNPFRKAPTKYDAQAGILFLALFIISMLLAMTIQNTTLLKLILAVPGSIYVIWLTIKTTEIRR
jgi:hypothetical protein